MQALPFVLPNPLASLASPFTSTFKQGPTVLMCNSPVVAPTQCPNNQPNLNLSPSQMTQLETRLR
ncbi:unnamed protein product [Protopolystoma xenopodis]|uniref:Uncharacterized protein n=1 Tax=Protopolystoma xenopodis TaxID=117903 RepID=A0A3S5CG43_9PLAT|nr:unnamed protein product [Protopolystoma xenopodis]